MILYIIYKGGNMDKINKDQEIKLNNMLEFLWRSVMDVNSYFQLIKQFHENENKYTDEMNISKAFYCYTYNALVLATISELSRIYDKNGNTSLISLMNYCEKNVKLITQIHTRSGKKIRDEAHIDGMLKKYRAEYENTSKFIGNLKKQRDKIYSHNDSKKIEDISRILKKNPLNIEEIEGLIYMVTIYLQYLFSLTTGIIKTPVVKHIDDWEQTLKSVSLSMEK